MKIETTPKNLWIAGSVVVALLVVLPNIGKGWDSLRYVTDAIPTAYAGQSKAEEVRSDFDRYITQREEELKLEKQRNQLQEEYNKKLIDIQQQQQMPQQQYPNQSEPQGLRVWDDTTQTFWCCR